MIMPPSSSMFTCVALPSSSDQRPVSVKPKAAAVEGVEMDQTVELGVAARCGLAPVPWPLGAEEIFDATPEARDVPRKAVPLDRARDAGLESLAECDHACKRVVGQHLAERGPHRSERQHV